MSGILNIPTGRLLVYRLQYTVTIYLDGSNAIHRGNGEGWFETQYHTGKKYWIEKSIGIFLNIDSQTCLVTNSHEAFLNACIRKLFSVAQLAPSESRRNIEIDCENMRVRRPGVRGGDGAAPSGRSAQFFVYVTPPFITRTAFVIFSTTPLHCITSNCQIYRTICN